jgi:hypothetical protein
MTLAVLRSFASFLPPGSLSANPMDHVTEDLGSSPISSGTLGGASQSFALPAFWDGKLLSEMLKTKDLNASNQVEAPLLTIQTFPDVRAQFDFRFENDVATVMFYADTGSRNINESAWELIRRSSLRENTRTYRFEEEFTNRGISGNEFRSLRVVALNRAGEPIGFRIVRFRLNGLLNME